MVKHHKHLHTLSTTWMRQWAIGLMCCTRKAIPLALRASVDCSLGDVVLVSSGASLLLGPSVPAPSPAPDGHPWSITLGTVAVVAASFLQLVASPSPLLSTAGFPEPLRDAFGYRRAEAGAMLTFFFRFKCNHKCRSCTLIHPCASWGCLRKRMLIDLGSSVGVGATSKGRSSSNSLNIHLRRSAAPCSTHELKLILVCLSTNLRHLVSLDSWRRELSGVIAGLGRGAGRLREQQRFALLAASQKNVLSVRDPPTWAARKREVCWQVFNIHQGLTAELVSGDPRRPSRSLFSRQPVINKVLSHGCRRMVDMVWMCPPLATFLLGSKEGASRSFEEPEGDTSDSV